MFKIAFYIKSPKLLFHCGKHPRVENAQQGRYKNKCSNTGDLGLGPATAKSVLILVETNLPRNDRLSYIFTALKTINDRRFYMFTALKTINDMRFYMFTAQKTMN